MHWRAFFLHDGVEMILAASIPMRLHQARDLSLYRISHHTRIIMPITIDVDLTAANEHLQNIDLQVRKNLINVLGPLAENIVADARANAAAHIHLLGKTPGKYLDSIEFKIVADDDRVVAHIQSADPLALLLEYGAERAAHEILPDTARALFFFFGGEEIFARVVIEAASMSPAFHDIERAFDTKLEDIMQAIIDAGSDRI
jgi:hypothetical protein